MCFYLINPLIGNNFTHDGRERNHSGKNSHLTNLPFFHISLSHSFSLQFTGIFSGTGDTAK